VTGTIRRGVTAVISVVLLSTLALTWSSAGAAESQDTSQLTAWISAGPNDAPYATVVAGVTLKGVFDTVKLGGKLTSRPAETRGGRKAIPISGTFTQSGETGKGTLYVSAGKQPLPVEFVGHAGVRRGSGRRNSLPEGDRVDVEVRALRLTPIIIG
jgi:hypothetical protein